VPAAASAWPLVAFTAPRASGLLRPRPARTTPESALTSMGSPRAVPVPCICRPSTPSAGTALSAMAARITACWEGPFGAVSELDRPSWFTAHPTTAAPAGPAAGTPSKSIRALQASPLV
jgi:hypothetical protein